MSIEKKDLKYIYVIAGNNLERIRKEHNLTQIQLADLIGYEESTISNIEARPHRSFSLEFLYIISIKLNVPMEEFFKPID